MTLYLIVAYYYDGKRKVCFIVLYGVYAGVCTFH